MQHCIFAETNNNSMKWSFNTEGFAKAVKTRRVIELGVGMREVTKKTKVSPATISRIEKGTIPDMGTFIKLMGWLDGYSPEAFFHNPKRKPQSK